MNSTNCFPFALALRSFAFVCLLALVTGCQLNSPDLSKVSTALTPTQQVYDCDDIGTTVEFTIPVSAIGPSHDKDISGATLIDPYITEECMCKIQSFTITLSGISEEDIDHISGESELDPSLYDITTDVDGNVVITIIRLPAYSDADLTFLIDLIAGTQPTVVAGGGLCIIENVSGSGGKAKIEIGQNFTQPVKVPASIGMDAYIPIP